MKTTLSLLLLFVSFSTFAGLPEDDFTVDLTRESFREGTIPTEADLYLNFQWVCGTYSTRPGTMTGTAGIALNEIFFMRVGNDIVNRSIFYSGRVPLRPTENEISSEILNEAGDVVAFYFMRKNHDGILIEKSIKTMNPVLPSLVMPELHAVSYSYCIPYDTNSQAPKVMNKPWSDVYTND